MTTDALSIRHPRIEGDTKTWLIALRKSNNSNPFVSEIEVLPITYIRLVK